jgi:hypothetical protein
MEHFSAIMQLGKNYKENYIKVNISGRIRPLYNKNK